MAGARFLAAVTLGFAGVAAAGGCTTLQPQPSTYFDQTIDPILQSSCVRTNTGVGCHVADVKGNAFGNLDVSTYDGVNRRRDLLLDYGPYLQPSLLVKNVTPYAIQVQLWNGKTIPITTDIKHTGGPILDPTASAYQILRRWIENGATQDNTGVAPVNLPRTPCNDLIPSTSVYPLAAGFNGNTDPTTKDWKDGTFQQQAEPVLSQSCAAGDCHGTLANALYLTCGRSPEEVRWNYFAASAYLAPTPEQSELLRRPLATSQGGSYHEGGPIYSSVNDTNYTAVKNWAADHGPPAAQTLDPAFEFFAEMVQPVLVKKGCMMAQCHSAGDVPRVPAARRLGRQLLVQHDPQELPLHGAADVVRERRRRRSSRLVRKNLYRPEGVDRARAASRTAAVRSSRTSATSLPSGALCDAAGYDVRRGAPRRHPGLLRRPRVAQARARRAQPAARLGHRVREPARSPPATPDRPQDFDVFAGGASLHVAPATFTGARACTLGADQAVDLTACGLGSGPDVRRPAVSWDATKIAFAARASGERSAGDLHDGRRRHGLREAARHRRPPRTGNGRLEHDFDPAFSPPGPDGLERLVFASTRGNLDSCAFDYSGPRARRRSVEAQREHLRVLEPDPRDGNVRQMTWQLNMERLPSFMQDGRLVFTAEKREPGFYQLALRRQNLDGSDYHPLYAQRATIGYTQATYVTELSHKDFAAIFSDSTAQHGAGSLIVFNRSIGIDFTSTNKADYLVDPTVINPAAPPPSRPTSSCTRSPSWRATARTPAPRRCRTDMLVSSARAIPRPSAATTTCTSSIPSRAPRRSCWAAPARPRSRRWPSSRASTRASSCAPATSRTATRRSTAARPTPTSRSST